MDLKALAIETIQNVNIENRIPNCKTTLSSLMYKYLESLKKGMGSEIVNTFHR